ncbi:MAG: hypothetical protein JXQ90_08210 [Cyclobacteriaceae bacterium]
MKSAFFIILLSLSSCKLADISNTELDQLDESEALANQLLVEVVKNQGFDLLQEHKTYTVRMTDNWPGWIGRMTKIWPEQKSTILFNFSFNTFDGQLIFESGEREGDLIGLQSWNLYHIKKSTPHLFEPNSLEVKHKFGLVTIHYFLELGFRLLNAPYKRYYGKKEKNGKDYDLVFVSWESDKPHPDYDQYVLWINAESGLIDYCIYTIRENKNPITRQLHGSIAFRDYRCIDGVKIPFTMPVMINSGALSPELNDGLIHQFDLHEFSLGKVDESVLYPFKNIPKIGDAK